MKKLLYTLLLTLPFFTSCEEADFGVKAADPQSWEQEEAITLPELTISPLPTISYYQIIDSVTIFNLSLNGTLPEGEPDRILNRPYRTSIYVPELAAGNRVMAFGDYSYYWIADRQGRSFKRLNELYATTGQVGFLASERVDGKLILSEAVKTLDIKAKTTS